MIKMNKKAYGIPLIMILILGVILFFTFKIEIMNLFDYKAKFEDAHRQIGIDFPGCDEFLYTPHDEGLYAFGTFCGITYDNIIKCVQGFRNDINLPYGYLSSPTPLNYAEVCTDICVGGECR